jgi:hypothetical protein
MGHFRRNNSAHSNSILGKTSLTIPVQRDASASRPNASRSESLKGQLEIMPQAGPLDEGSRAGNVSCVKDCCNSLLLAIHSYLFMYNFARRREVGAAMRTLASSCSPFQNFM